MELSNTKAVVPANYNWDEDPVADCQEVCCGCSCEEGSPIEVFAKSIMNDKDYEDVKVLDKEASQQYENWVNSLPKDPASEMVTATKIAKEADIEIAKINKESNIEVAKINAEAKSCKSSTKECKPEECDEYCWNNRHKNRKENPVIILEEIRLSVDGHQMTITSEDINMYCGDTYWTFAQLENDTQVYNIVLNKIFNS